MSIICVLNRNDFCGCRGDNGSCVLKVHSNYAECQYRRTAENGVPAKQPTQCLACDRKSRGCDCKITCTAFIPIGD